MKIYFSSSISQMDDEIRANCTKMITHLQQKGHSVEHDRVLKKQPKHYEAQTEEEALKIQKKLSRLRKNADILFFEVTKQSIGIGQELGLSLTLNKPVIALYRRGHKPHILRDEGGDLLLLSSYTDENLTKVVDEAIDYAASHQDVRFNFFISPTIGQYLDWISSKKKIPRSVYLRNLIEKDIEENQEYNTP